jgi:hypothetical protein
MKLGVMTRLRIAVMCGFATSGLMLLSPSTSAGQSSACGSTFTIQYCRMSCSTSTCPATYAGCGLRPTSIGYCSHPECSDDWDAADNLIFCSYGGSGAWGGGGETDE